ncbi:MAG: general secretion pathway protein GspL [Gallionella sp.]|nr:general secretion pathway protein GspL [Gallionella sp.]
MTTLYIQLPCKATADLHPRWQDLACRYALVGGDGIIAHEAVTPLTHLSATIAKAQRLVVMLAACDVTLVQVGIPPLSPAKLKAALPNLIEDQVLDNPVESVTVAGGVTNGLLTAAVVQRAWLESIHKALIALGAQNFSLVPAQLCLPPQAGQAVAVAHQDGDHVNLTLRLSEQAGMGVALMTQQPDEVIQSLNAVVANTPIMLYVTQKNIQPYQTALNNSGLTARIHLAADAWPLWIAGSHGNKLNLLAGLNSEASIKVDWQPWRWALILAVTILLVNIFALNFDWWQMKNEATSLRATMTQIYQARYPKESVIIDPIAQMQQKIAFAKRDSGLASSDDFTMLAANFGEAWNTVTSSDKPAIAKLEYREHSLFVSLKANQNNNNEALIKQMQAALTRRNLSLNVAPAESGLVSWQIRSMK